MKKVFYILLILSLLALWGCNADVPESHPTEQELPTAAPTEVENPTSPAPTEGQAPTEPETSHILVAYFSATGTTRPIAERLARLLGADLFEIVPAQPYTEADLNYRDDTCRANREQADPAARPEIAASVADMARYDVVFLGHPIWWGEEPRILDTFLEQYDWTGKTMVSFCTSGGSGITTASAHLQALAPAANWLTGERFPADAGESELQDWLNRLNWKEEQKMYIKIADHTLTVALADNSSAAALLEHLREGDVTVNARDFGNFEKVGPLGFRLPTNDTQITTTPGDLILYQGDQITLYYDTNTWDFTLLGHVEGLSQAELMEILGDGDVTMVLSCHP